MDFLTASLSHIKKYFLVQVHLNIKMCIELEDNGSNKWPKMYHGLIKTEVLNYYGDMVQESRHVQKWQVKSRSHRNIKPCAVRAT